MIIRMPGGSVWEGVCIAAGVAAVGACEWRNENGGAGEWDMLSVCVWSEWGTSRGKMEGLIYEVVEV
jgi:hypothetical protein